MQSKIHMSESVDNKERKFGSWKNYFPSEIKLEDGTKIKALFTMDQLNVAMDRAAKNSEDFEEDNFWDWLFNK